MIPEDCALTVQNGVVCVVGPEGDIRPGRDVAGVYANDTQYLDRVAIDVTDRNAPTRGWDRLERRAGPAGITTVLIGGAPGDGRGDSREFVVKKRFSIHDQTVTIETTIRSHAAEKRVLDLETSVGGLFRHVFECSGFFAPRDPVRRETFTSDSDGSDLALVGVSPDGTSRRATVTVEGVEAEREDANGGGAHGVFKGAVRVPPGEEQTVTVSVTVEPLRGEPPDPVDFDLQLATSLGISTERSQPDPSDDDVERVLERAADTLQSLMLPEGIPAAGAPRFVAPFGRDALLVGFQTLPFAPGLTKHILDYFAGEQASATNDRTRAEPGKIPHEKRLGDLPALGRSIRSPYYGNVDATALFAALVTAYTDQVPGELSDGLYEAATDAVEWIVESSDENEFLWYDPHDHEYGLTHLGWKDSSSAIAHPDGTAATPPIALAEAQGYAYRALRSVASLAHSRGDMGLAASLTDRADRLQQAFNTQFWLPEERCYALALDADGPVKAVASNQGHALWSGIVPTDRADDVIDRLLASDMLTPVGVRTCSSAHAAFDPLSYHRGSVWPHDTSLVALGCARYDRMDAVHEIAGRGVAALSRGLTAAPDRWGFPELLVGLTDPDVDAGRARHPDSCEPAAWSAGSAFGFAQAVLMSDGRVSVQSLERIGESGTNRESNRDTNPEVTING